MAHHRHHHHHHHFFFSFFFFFFFSPLSLIIFLAVLIIPAAGADDLGGANTGPCEGTDYRSLCRRFVEGVTDPAIATEKLIGAIKEQTNKVMGRPELEECKGMYEKVVEDLDTSVRNIKQQDKNALQNNLSSVIANYESCNDALTEKGMKPPPNNVNNWLSHMAANCLGLVDQMVF